MEGTETKEGRPILSKGEIQAAILFSFIGLVFFGHMYYEWYKLKRFGLVIRAYAYDIAYGRNGGLEYRFNVNGHQYTGAFSSSSSSAVVGDSLTIIYDPDDPAKNSAPACDVLDKYKDVQ